MSRYDFHCDPVNRPLACRLWAWSEERFPLSQGVFVALFYATCLLLGRFVTSDGLLLVDAYDVLGFFACWALFLMLRIFDEHKDYMEDLYNHPQRVLQSGQINLGHLKVLGVIAILGQVAFSVWVDQGFGMVTGHWLVVFGWSLLMAVEFFVPRWLNAHFVLYGISHMLVMVLVTFWLISMGAQSPASGALVWYLAALAFFSGCAFECTRKAWGKEEERDTIGSYAREFGIWGVAAVITLVMGLAQLGSLIMLAYIVGLQYWWWGVAPLVAWLLVALTVTQYVRQPTRRARKINEAVVGLGMLIAHGTPLLAMVITRGLRWTV